MLVADIEPSYSYQPDENQHIAYHGSPRYRSRGSGYRRGYLPSWFVPSMGIMDKNIQIVGSA